MSPRKLLSEPTYELTQIEKPPEDKHNYGAVLTGLDLNNIGGKLCESSMARPETDIASKR